jgi:hypothetical protein
MDAGVSTLMWKVHHLLDALAVADEVRATAKHTFSWSAFATSVNGENGTIGFGVGHSNTGQVDGQHGVSAKGIILRQCAKPSD